MRYVEFYGAKVRGPVGYITILFWCPLRLGTDFPLARSYSIGSHMPTTLPRKRQSYAELSFMMRQFEDPLLQKPGTALINERLGCYWLPMMK